jgi:hypothetical protein
MPTGNERPSPGRTTYYVDAHNGSDANAGVFAA